MTRPGWYAANRERGARERLEYYHKHLETSRARGRAAYQRRKHTGVFRLRNAANYARGRALTDRMKTRPCADCGGTFPPCVMDFDHLDPTTKVAPVALLRGTQQLLIEIAKCEVVCANCHRVRTWKRRQQQHQEASVNA